MIVVGPVDSVDHEDACRVSEPVPGLPEGALADLFRRHQAIESRLERLRQAEEASWHAIPMDLRLRPYIRLAARPGAPDTLLAYSHEDVDRIEAGSSSVQGEQLGLEMFRQNRKEDRAYFQECRDALDEKVDAYMTHPQIATHLRLQREIEQAEGALLQTEDAIFDTCPRTTTEAMLKMDFVLREMNDTISPEVDHLAALLSECSDVIRAGLGSALDAGDAAQRAV